MRRSCASLARMRRAVLVLSLLITSSVASACGSTSPSKDLGCLNDLGHAEDAFNATADGLRNGTTTASDDSAAMKTVKERLDDLAIVNPLPAIKAKASEASVFAGRIRVAIESGGSFADAEDVAGLRADINALDAACVAAGK